MNDQNIVNFKRDISILNPNFFTIYTILKTYIVPIFTQNGKMNDKKFLILSEI